MEPNCVLKLTFSDGSIACMLVYLEDTSDEALQAEIDRSVYPRGAPTSWERTTIDDVAFAELRAGR